MKELELTIGMQRFNEESFESYVHKSEQKKVKADLSLGVLNPENRSSRYSDPNFTRFKNEVSKYLDVNINQISIGSGIDSTLEILPQIFVGDIVISSPEFPRFKELGIRYNREIHDVSRSNNNNFEFDDSTIEGILEHMNEEQKIVMISTSNNPTGQVLSLEYISQLVDRAQERHFLVLDMAYGEFAGVDYVNEVAKIASENENVLALFTMSKARGLAGKCRLGYGISSKGIAKQIEDYRLPFTPSGESVAIRSLKNPYKLNRAIKGARKKQQFIESIVDSNFNLEMVRNSKTNIALIRGTSFDLGDYLMTHGIKTSPHPWIKDSNNESLSYTRITLGNWWSVRKLGNRLKKI